MKDDAKCISIENIDEAVLYCCFFILYLILSPACCNQLLICFTMDVTVQSGPLPFVKLTAAANIYIFILVDKYG